MTPIGYITAALAIVGIMWSAAFVGSRRSADSAQIWVECLKKNPVAECKAAGLESP